MSRLPQRSYSASPSLQYPRRIIRERDAHLLYVIASGAMQSSPALAVALLDELGRAAILPDTEAPPENIGIGSKVVCFESDGTRSRYHRAQIVVPEDAAPRLERVSVLSDLGAALIGLAPHQSILWRDARGGARHFSVLEVESPAHEDQPSVEG
jgi:regulator of nucleoside diphosphate kinase